MPYVYENVDTVAARALLKHPEFDTRLRPLLDEMNDAIRRGEAGAPYLPPAVATAKNLYEGDPGQAALFVWCCAKEAWAENYKSAVRTTLEKLRRGDVLVSEDGVERVVLGVRLGVDTLGSTGTTLRLRSAHDYSLNWPRWTEVRRLRRQGERIDA